MGTIRMSESEIASIQLAAMFDDIDARTLFAKGGPLSWFSLTKTSTSAFRKGTLTEKQIPLILSVYQQYMKLKSVSKRFSATGQSREIAALLYRVLREKPKVASKEDRSRSARLSSIVRAFHDGVNVHIGYFNAAESLIKEFPIENRIAILEMIHSTRKAYLAKLNGLN